MIPSQPPPILPLRQSGSKQLLLALVADLADRVLVDGFWGRARLEWDVQDGSLLTVRTSEKRTHKPLDRAA